MPITDSLPTQRECGCLSYKPVDNTGNEVDVLLGTPEWLLAIEIKSGRPLQGVMLYQPRLILEARREDCKVKGWQNIE